jgi:diaminopimelate epimerase
MTLLSFTKAHAYGNDFLYVRDGDARAVGDRTLLARAMCDRHRGVGADGLIFYTLTTDGARMTLLNADGSPAELSGNGLRGLAALLARMRNSVFGDPPVRVETAAGSRTLYLEERAGSRYRFRADMGMPSAITRETLTVGEQTVTASVLSIGNPQCVVLGPLPDDDQFGRLGPALETHVRFPERTNVEFACVEAPDRVRIRIWERGVGPTESSGTGSCAAAVAAAAHGGASRQVDVIAPGGTQRVVWTDQGVELTGWAEIVCDGMFSADLVAGLR